jgi:hypothetical protein
MSDWLPLMEVEEIRAGIESGQATHVVKPAAMRAAARRSVANPPTPITYAPAVAAPARAQLAPTPPNSVEYAPPPLSPPAAPEPARVRNDARHARQDLFGNIAKAGSEQDLLKSSSVPLESYRDKPTGARNESSVLFSLNTVRAGVGPTSAPPRGIIAAPPQTAADILGMNMSGGLPGVEVNAALTSAPVVEPPPRPQVLAPPRRDRMDTLPPTAKRRARPVIVGMVVFVAAAMAAGSVYVLRARVAMNHGAPTPTAEPARTGEPAVVASSPTANMPGSTTATPPPTGTSVDTAPAPIATTPPATAVPGPAPKPGAPGPTPKPGAQRPAPAPAPQKGAEKPAPGAKGEQKIVLEEEPSAGNAPAAKGAKAEAPSGAPAAPEPEKPPFDMTAAKAALEASAASAASCKTADGPTGKGKVQVTFSPSGRVTSAAVVEGTFGGTPVGGCIAKLFRGAHVPAFSGDPVTVAKGFTIPE